MRFQFWLVPVLVLVPMAAGCFGDESDADGGGATAIASAPPEDVTSLLQGWVFAPDLTPIVSATVTVIETGAAQQTDVEGYFEFFNLVAGDYVLEAGVDGYRPARDRVHVEEGYASVLNFTLEPVPAEVPHDELTTFTGQVSCSLMTGEDPETSTRQECGDADPTNVPSHVFEVGPKAADVRIEIFFAPTTAAAQQLTLKVELLDVGTPDLQYAYLFVEPGAQVSISQGSLERYFPGGGRVRVTASAGPGLHQDPVPQGAGLALAQRFDIDFTVFYIEPGPDDYTARP